MRWGFPHRSRNKDGAHKRGGCHWEPGLRKKGHWWLQMHLAAVVGTQPSHHGAVCALKEKRGSVCELKGLIHRSW